MNYITDYNILEQTISSMISGCSPLPSDNESFNSNPDATRIFIMYRGSSWDAPEQIGSVNQKETLQFDFFIFSPKRADINSAFIRIQKAIVGKKLDGYERFYADIAGNFQYDDKLPADFVLTIKTSRPSIWDDTDSEDVDNEDDNFEINELKNPEFNE